MAFVAVLALLGGLSLAGCRTQPGVAAYVNGHRYTVAEVSAYVNELNGKVEGFLQINGDLQQELLTLLLIRDLGHRIADERHLSIPAADPTPIAVHNGLAPSSPLARLVAELDATVQTLIEQLPPVQPSEAQQREVFTNLLVNGQSGVDDFERVRPLLTQDVIGAQLALRDALREAAVRYHVTVNPRYAPLAYPIKFVVAATAGLTVSSSLAVPLGQPTGPVPVRRA
jgi:hypothetical protein